jgi:AAA15 family ATPase/GTPase
MGMLVEFRVENHRSIRDEQALTMEAGPVSPEKPRSRKVVGHSREILLPVAALYGANASGKSNVLSALGFMRDAVIDSHRSWPPEGGTPREAFAWGSNRRSPSMFEATFFVDGVRHQYGFLLDQTRVQEEWLFSWPKGRRQTWLERDADKLSFGAHLRGENRVIEQVTRPNALFLSTAAQHKHEQLLPIYGWFRQIQTVRVEGYKERYADAMPAAVAAAMFAAAAAAAAASADSQGGMGMIRVSDLIEPHGERGGAADAVSSLDKDGAEKLRNLMKAADIGLSDFRIDKDRSGTGASKKDPRQVLMRHDIGGSEAWLPLEQESGGTKALFRLGPAVIEALARGSLLVIDELEASLHTSVAAQLVSLFNDQRTNPRNAQLIFTTHDTNLLGTTLRDPPLRRDQIWLTEKDPAGATTLYPLTDFKPRSAENLERGYLQGRYGAIPFLGGLARIAG